jgi:hypothetical protein
LGDIEAIGKGSKIFTIITLAKAKTVKIDMTSLVLPDALFFFPSFSHSFLL